MGGSRAGDEEEIRELREKLVSLTAQLDESNRAWEEYKEAQVAMLRDRLERSLSLDYERSLEEIAGQIVDQVTQEREDSNEKYQALERANNDLQSDARLESIRQPYVSTIDELNQELSTMKEAYDQLSQRTLQTAPEPLSSDPPAAAVTEVCFYTFVFCVLLTSSCFSDVSPHQCSQRSSGCRGNPTIARECCRSHCSMCATRCSKSCLANLSTSTA